MMIVHSSEDSPNTSLASGFLELVNKELAKKFKGNADAETHGWVLFGSDGIGFCAVKQNPNNRGGLLVSLRPLSLLPSAPKAIDDYLKSLGQPEETTHYSFSDRAITASMAHPEMIAQMPQGSVDIEIPGEGSDIKIRYLNFTDLVPNIGAAELLQEATGRLRVKSQFILLKDRSALTELVPLIV